MNEYVNALYLAYENKRTVNQLSMDKHMPLTLAYDIQARVLQRKEETEALKGYKVSLTSDETQRMFMSDEPLYGAMCGSTVFQDGAKIDLYRFNEPLLELELIFLVQEELKLTDTVEDIMNKCLIAPGVELPDSRFQNWFPNLTIAEIVTDSAVSGAVVIGEGKRLSYDAISNIKGELFFNNHLLVSGRSTEVLNHPAESVKWLIKAIAAQGRTLLPGMFVSSGTFNLPKPLVKGDYKAIYETVGTVSFTVK